MTLKEIRLVQGGMNSHGHYNTANPIVRSMGDPTLIL